MALVRGFEHDVFVSYARLDNEPSDSSGRGWVDRLVAELQRELSQRVGGRDVRVWMDHELAGNRPLTPEIMAVIRRSATLLVVMSPGYLRSEWCARERRQFLDHVEGQVQTGAVFLVHARKVQGMPKEFGDLLGYRFWTDDLEARADRPLEVLDGGHISREYSSRIVRLSHELKTQLESMKPGIGASSAMFRVPGHGPVVFIARATEDLEEREEELRSYLGQAGIGVLPQRRYALSDQRAFESAMLGDLGKSKLFVQLLSASRGHELDFLPTKRHPLFQSDLARSAGVPMLQWRDRSVDPDSIRDPAHKALVDGARSCGIEEFKRVVVEQAYRDPEPRPPKPTTCMVFVNADASDRGLAQDVAHTLAQLGVECYWPLAHGTPEAIRTDLEENLRVCDGLLLVYGATGAHWVRHQLRQGRKIMSQRERQLSALAVVEGPPPKEGDLGLAMPKLVILNCQAGIDRAALSRFVADLNH